MSVTLTDLAVPSSLESVVGTGAMPAGVRAMTAEKLEAIRAAAKRLRENPSFEEYNRAVEEYRRLNNTVPDPD